MDHMKKEHSIDAKDISNLVGIVKISDDLDLKKIFIELENASFEPEQFSGLIYRSEDPVGTVTLFKNGKAICTGTKNPKMLKEIISNLVDKLNYLEIPVYKNYKIEIKNMVFTKTLKHPINLAKVALSFGLENVDYEPDDFPGLSYKTDDPRATFIIFESGKIICTGTSSIAQAEEAYKILEKKFIRNKII
jgi:transcription initiation factor TFIID TATA-box-binding protein